MISDARVKYADFAKKTELRIAVGAMRRALMVEINKITYLQTYAEYPMVCSLDIPRLCFHIEQYSDR